MDLYFSSAGESASLYFWNPPSMAFTAGGRCGWPESCRSFLSVPEASSWDLLHRFAQQLGMWQPDIGEDIPGSAHCSALTAVRTDLKRHMKEGSLLLPLTGIQASGGLTILPGPFALPPSLTLLKNQKTKQRKTLIILGQMRQLCPNPII